ANALERFPRNKPRTARYCQKSATGVPSSLFLGPAMQTHAQTSTITRDGKNKVISTDTPTVVRSQQ
ncbi:hypothetical protein CLU79DRAFT_768912, partial [Phycomyces nitens]